VTTAGGPAGHRHRGEGVRSGCGVRRLLMLASGGGLVGGMIATARFGSWVRRGGSDSPQLLTPLESRPAAAVLFGSSRPRRAVGG